MTLMDAGGALVSLQPRPAGKTERMKGTCNSTFKRKPSLPPGIFTVQSPCKQCQHFHNQAIWQEAVGHGYKH